MKGLRHPKERDYNPEGLRAAREATLPGVPWQRCQMHLQQNAQAYVTKSAMKEEVAADIRSIFQAGSLDEAKRHLHRDQRRMGVRKLQVHVYH